MGNPEELHLHFYDDAERKHTVANVIGTAVAGDLFAISPDELFAVLDTVHHGDALYVTVALQQQNPGGTKEAQQPERLHPAVETTFQVAEGTVTVFSDRPSITINGETVALTPQQNAFFRTLLENAGTTVPYSKFGSHQLRDRAQALSNRLMTLRRRLAGRVNIYTERGVGPRIERLKNTDE